MNIKTTLVDFVWRKLHVCLYIRVPAGARRKASTTGPKFIKVLICCTMSLYFKFESLILTLTYLERKIRALLYSLYEQSPY